MITGAALLGGVTLLAPAAWADDRTTTGTIVLGGTYECRGEPAVLADGDEWNATMGDDVVVAVAGEVGTVNLLDGDDVLCIHPMDPREGDGVIVNAGIGNDTVVTYGGHYHEIHLDAGDDIAYLNGYHEDVWGGPATTTCGGSAATGCILRGESGTDILQGSPAADHLWGGPVGDLLIGADGNDILDGNGDNDNIQGGAGFDTIDGGANADTCTDTFGITTSSPARRRSTRGRAASRPDHPTAASGGRHHKGVGRPAPAASKPVTGTRRRPARRKGK